jgi:hypothetical protein
MRVTDIVNAHTRNRGDVVTAISIGLGVIALGLLAAGWGYLVAWVMRRR